MTWRDILSDQWFYWVWDNYSVLIAFLIGAIKSWAIVSDRSHDNTIKALLRSYITTLPKEPGKAAP